ncbi:MAG: hypothetical protein LBR87_07650, partial [Synergistaceae bacterium]|nr:hypothetical protein [Synergistaceae bacterium]
MRYQRKIFRVVAFLLVFSVVFTPTAETGLALAAWLDPPVDAPGKNEVGVDDDEDVNRRLQKANVLFFLDTSHPMALEPRGRLPYVVGNTSTGAIDSQATYNAYGYNASGAIDLMKYFTFGVGTVPPVDSFLTARLKKWVHYGRDTDPRNNLGAGGGPTDINDPANQSRYYSPYNYEGHNLAATFVNQQDAYPGTGNTGLGYNFKTAVAGGHALPYMLVFKNPAYWRNGMPGFNPSNAAHQLELVPNDSRLYQTKLVMWRLLEDRMLFENIRFGLSTVYSIAFTARTGGSSTSETNKGFTSDMPSQGMSRTTPANHVVYKVNPYGANSTFINGAYWLNAAGTTWSNTGQSTEVQGGTWGIYGSSGAVTNRQRRSFLRVPIADYDKEWTTKGGAV